MKCLCKLFIQKKIDKFSLCSLINEKTQKRENEEPFIWFVNTVQLYSKKLQQIPCKIYFTFLYKSVGMYVCISVFLNETHGLWWWIISKSASQVHWNRMRFDGKFLVNLWWIEFHKPLRLIKLDRSSELIRHNAFLGTFAYQSSAFQNVRYYFHNSKHLFWISISERTLKVLERFVISVENHSQYPLYRRNLAMCQIPYLIGVLLRLVRDHVCREMDPVSSSLKNNKNNKKH